MRGRDALFLVVGLLAGAILGVVMAGAGLIDLQGTAAVNPPVRQSFYSLDLRVDLPNDAERLRWMRRLIARGHLDQIVISHDICYRSRLCEFGGHGYAHIFANVVPLMRRRSFSETEIDRILVGTPRRLLAFI